MVPKLSTTDQQERILMAQSTSHLQFAMVRELLLVLMDQPLKFASTPAVTMRRNAQLVRAKERWTNLLLHVLMAQSASVQEVERTANSTTEYVAMDKDAGKCRSQSVSSFSHGRLVLQWQFSYKSFGFIATTCQSTTQPWVQPHRPPPRSPRPPRLQVRPRIKF